MWTTLVSYDSPDRRSDVPQFLNEICVGPLARSRSAAQKDQFLRKSEPLPTVVDFKLLPDPAENQLGVFDFKIRRSGRPCGEILGV